MDNIEPVQEENLEVQEHFIFAYFINDETAAIEFGNVMREGFRLATEEEIAEHKRNIEAMKPPRELSKLSIVDAFIALGIVTEALQVINYDPVVKLRWDAAVSIYANDQSLVQICTALNITVEQLIETIDKDFANDESE